MNNKISLDARCIMVTTIVSARIGSDERYWEYTQPQSNCLLPMIEDAERVADEIIRRGIKYYGEKENSANRWSRPKGSAED